MPKGTSYSYFQYYTSITYTNDVLIIFHRHNILFTKEKTCILKSIEFQRLPFMPLKNTSLSFNAFPAPSMSWNVMAGRLPCPCNVTVCWMYAVRQVEDRSMNKAHTLHTPRKEVQPFIRIFVTEYTCRLIRMVPLTHTAVFSIAHQHYWTIHYQVGIAFT